MSENEKLHDTMLTRGSTSQQPPSATHEPGEMLILVVERDPHVRELETHYLRQAGFKVSYAADGAEALKQAQAHPPDIMITEILVPKLDGLALCRQIKGAPATRDTIVLIFSILAAKSRATEAGADAFLMKPLAEHRLLGAVRALMDQRKQALELM